MFSKPLATAMRRCMPATSSSLSVQGRSGVASEVSHASKGGFSPVSRYAAVRSAASMTPPVRPNRVAAPVEVPRGSSKGSSGRAAQSMESMFSRRSNSRVVSTASTSRPSSVASWGTSHSYFFARQGMMDRQKTRLPCSAACLPMVFFTTAPIIW